MITLAELLNMDEAQPADGLLSALNDGWTRRDLSPSMHVTVFRKIPGTPLLIVVEAWKNRYVEKHSWKCYVQPDGLPVFQNIIGVGSAASLELCLYEPLFRLDLCLKDNLAQLYDENYAREMFVVNRSEECLPFATVFPHADLSIFEDMPHIIISSCEADDVHSYIHYQHHAKFEPLDWVTKHEPPPWLPGHIIIDEEL